MDYIKTGDRVGVVHILPDNKLTRTGVPLTRADYLVGRAGTEGRTGTIIGFPAGHAGSLWKVALDPVASPDGTADGAKVAAGEPEVKVYSPMELAPADKLAEARQCFLAGVQMRQNLQPQPAIYEDLARQGMDEFTQVVPAEFVTRNVYTRESLLAARRSPDFPMPAPTPIEELSAADQAELREAMAALGAGGAIPLEHLKAELDGTASGPLEVATGRCDWFTIPTDAVIVVIDLRDDEAHQSMIHQQLIDMAGEHFHDQLLGKWAADLKVYETVAPVDRQLAFKRVLFVFKHSSTIREAVLAGLRYADEHGYKDVVVPMITFFPELNPPPKVIQDLFVAQVRPALKDIRDTKRRSLGLIYVTAPPLATDSPSAPPKEVAPGGEAEAAGPAVPGEPDKSGS